MISIGPALFILGIAATLFFVIGWNLSVYKFRRDQRIMAANYEKLADRYEELAVLMSQEPTRAGIDVGKDFVIYEVEQLCREIRQGMEHT